MHVILTVDFSPWSAYSGGAQRSTQNLAKALCRRGHSVDVIFTKPPWEHVEVPEDRPYALHWATFFDLRSRRKAPLRPLNAWSVARMAHRLMQPGIPTVIHSNGEEGGLIHTLRKHRQFVFISTPRHPRYPKALLEIEDPSLSTWMRLVLTEGKYLMQGSAARHADLCCPPSAFAAELVRQAFEIPFSRFRVVHNGFPEDFLHFSHRADAVGSGPLIFFGRFEPSKGVDTLVDALGRLGTQAPHTLIIGRGEDRDAILSQIERRGLGGRVHVLPWMTHEQLGEALSGASMVVLPSREENFSLAALSAMAVGAPVICTRVGGTPEIIEDGVTGLLVAPNDPQALAAAIQCLQDRPALAQQIAQAGRTHVRQHFTWDVAARKFEALYEVLLCGAAQRSDTH